MIPRYLMHVPHFRDLGRNSFLSSRVLLRKDSKVNYLILWMIIESLLILICFVIKIVKIIHAFSSFSRRMIIFYSVMWAHVRTVLTVLE